MRCNFNRRNSRGENKGGKELGGKGKYYACMRGMGCEEKLTLNEKEAG